MAKKLGEILVVHGLLTEAQVKTALRTQEFFGGHLGSILIDLGFLDEQSLGDVLSKSTGARYAPPEFLEDIAEDVLKIIPARVAERLRVVPALVLDKALHLVMLDPKDLVALDEVAALTGMTVVPYVAPEFRLYEALERHYDVRSLRSERIAMPHKLDIDSLVAAKSRPGTAAPPKKPSVASGPEIGLDGLPLDTELPPSSDAFFPDPPPEEPDDSLEEPPRSLREWRESVVAAPPAAPPTGWGGPAVPPAAVPAPPQAPGPATGAPPAMVPHRSPPGDPLSEGANRFTTAETRDDIGEILLNATAPFLRRRLLFLLQRDRIVGWDGGGDSVSRERIQSVLLPLESLSMFTVVRSSAEPFRGPVAGLTANQRLFSDLGLPIPPEVILVPIVLKRRVVSVLYGDNGPSGVGHVDMEALRRISLQAAMAFEILILRKKILSV